MSSDNNNMIDEYIFIDVETNGIGSFRPPTQRIVQFAWIYNKKKKSFFVQDVSKVASSVPHVYDPPFLQENGIDFANGFENFLSDVKTARGIIAHNADFDIGCIINELFLRNYSNDIIKLLQNTPVICTMKATTNLCKLPSTSSYTSYKWPKLIELYEFLFNESPNLTLHDALNDCIITKNCVEKMLNMDILNFNVDN